MKHYTRSILIILALVMALCTAAFAENVETEVPELPVQTEEGSFEAEFSETDEAWVQISYEICCVWVSRRCVVRWRLSSQ